VREEELVAPDFIQRKEKKMGVWGWILGGAFFLLMLGGRLFVELMSAALGSLATNWPF
jgi:hypothetical protein